MAELARPAERGQVTTLLEATKHCFVSHASPDPTVVTMPCLHGSVIKTLALQCWLSSEGSQDLSLGDPRGILAQLLGTLGKVSSTPSWDK